MVDTVDLAVEPFQHMPGLAVGVVRDDVEDRHPLHLRAMYLAQRIVEHLLVRLDVKLDCADTVWPIPDDCLRYHVPAKPAIQQIGCILAAVERAIGKIPQWCLALARLIDRDIARFALAVAESSQEGVVRAPRHQFVGDNLALAQQARTLGQIRGLLRAQLCPESVAGTGGGGNLAETVASLHRWHLVHNGSSAKWYAIRQELLAVG